jgi:hypothetical protein
MVLQAVKAIRYTPQWICGKVLESRSQTAIEAALSEE